MVRASGQSSGTRSPMPGQTQDPLARITDSTAQKLLERRRSVLSAGTSLPVPGSGPTSTAPKPDPAPTLPGIVVTAPQQKISVTSAPGRATGPEGGSQLQPQQMKPDSNFNPSFTSDLGRTKFGFSREEIDSSGYYEGQFKMYQRSGQGILYFQDTGDKYVGQFADDLFHGEGHRTWEDTSEYKGQWTRGQKHGRGGFSSADNLKYLGQWANGLRHGQGMQEYANGDRYEGWWFNGMCSGLGTYYFVDGSKYEGAWANGRYDGPGILAKAEGTRERHVYKHGVLVSRDLLPCGKDAAIQNVTHVRRRAPKVPARQRREMMQRPTLFPKMVPSQYLIKRETFGEDLSSPPLSARLRTAESYKMSGHEKASFMDEVKQKLEAGSAPLKVETVELESMPSPPPRTAPAAGGSDGNSDRP